MPSFCTCFISDLNECSDVNETVQYFILMLPYPQSWRRTICTRKHIKLSNCRVGCHKWWRTILPFLKKVISGFINAIIYLSFQNFLRLPEEISNLCLFILIRIRCATFARNIIIRRINHILVNPSPLYNLITYIKAFCIRCNLMSNCQGIYPIRTSFNSR